MIKELTEKEKRTIVGTFELTYGYSGKELVKISKPIAEIFRKLGMNVHREGENHESND